jgi:hypothetical protein
MAWEEFMRTKIWGKRYLNHRPWWKSLLRDTVNFPYYALCQKEYVCRYWWQLFRSHWWPVKSEQPREMKELPGIEPSAFPHFDAYPNYNFELKNGSTTLEPWEIELICKIGLPFHEATRAALDRRMEEIKSKINF